MAVNLYVEASEELRLEKERGSEGVKKWESEGVKGLLPWIRGEDLRENDGSDLGRTYLMFCSKSIAAR